MYTVHNPFYVTSDRKIKFIFQIIQERYIPKKGGPVDLVVVTKEPYLHNQKVPFNKMKLKALPVSTPRFATKERAQHEIMRRERFPED